MKDSVKKVWHLLGNKYVLATIFFVVIFCFVDQNSVLVSSKLRRQVRQLHKEEAALYTDYQSDSIEAQSLKNDREAIERYGRENYYMKRANEDIFIITSDERK